MANTSNHFGPILAYRPPKFPLDYQREDIFLSLITSKRALLKTATPLVYNSKTTDLTLIQDRFKVFNFNQMVLGTTDLTLIQDNPSYLYNALVVLGTTDLTLIQDTER